MQLKFFGHSAVLLSGSKNIIIDPFFKDGRAPSGIDLVAVTHGHRDHLGETVSINRLTVAGNEIAKYLEKKGLNTVGLNIGGSAFVEGVSFMMTPALHSSWIEEAGPGVYGGVAGGYVIEMDGKRIYHAGDTGLFSDMKLIGEYLRPDIALLPIGGKFTMGPDEAMIAAQFIGAKIVIPIHYNTWPVIEQDPGMFKFALERTTDIKVIVLKPGEDFFVN